MFSRLNPGASKKLRRKRTELDSRGSNYEHLRWLPVRSDERPEPSSTCEHDETCGLWLRTEYVTNGGCRNSPALGSVGRLVRSGAWFGRALVRSGGVAPAWAEQLIRPRHPMSARAARFPPPTKSWVLR